MLKLILLWIEDAYPIWWNSKGGGMVGYILEGGISLDGNGGLRFGLLHFVIIVFSIIHALHLELNHRFNTTLRNVGV